MNDTADLLRRLRHRYDGRDGTIILFEVGDGAGFSNRGWSDAIAMQTWPSKGLEITGFEVKATRADWLRELDQPEKNRTWQDRVDSWYIVAAKNVVLLDELPATWGLMLPRGEYGLKIARRATTTDSYQKIISRDLVAALFRAAGNERNRTLGRAREEIRQEQYERLKDEIETAEAKARKWQSSYEELAGTIGSRWDSVDRLKQRVEAVLALENANPRLAVERARKQVESVAERLRKIEESIDQDSTLSGIPK